MSGSDLVLASGSGARRMLLANAGFKFEVVVAGVDEAAVKQRLAGSAPDQLAIVLAACKAEAVSRLRPQALVIGADQVLECEGRLFDKPADLDEARAHLRLLRGRRHRLLAAVCVARGGETIWRCCERAELEMTDFSEPFLEAYLRQSGELVLSSVGCYRLEGLGPHLFRRIDGDYFTILGLPLLPLLAFLAQHGLGLA